MNAEQFNEIVEKYSDNVYGFILKNIRSTDTANDIVQEAFERLWKNRKKVDSAKAKSYLFTTAYHILIDITRKEKRNSDIETEDNYVYNEGYTDLHEILNYALDKLPAQQKQLILLRDYEGYSYKEIGEITGLSESQVKVYIFRARKILKNFIVKVENLI